MNDEIVEALAEERLKHYTIINYILNKNSHPMPKGIMYTKAYDDLEDYERYLSEML